MAQFVMRGIQNDEITNNNPEELLVIGAGLPRTGTLSLKAALTKLYKGKCYHMKEVFNGDQEDLDIWYNGKKNAAEDWRSYFKKKGFVTGCDYPFAIFWKELADAYPNAKVVLSTRDPETWYRSVTESIYQFNELARRSYTFSTMLRMFDWRKGAGGEWIEYVMVATAHGMEGGMGAAIDGGPDTAKQFFLDWEESIKRTIPSDRLLVHSAGEGWEPLCNFLGFPVPDEPYPRINDTKAIQQEVRNLKMMNFMIFYVSPVLLGIAGYCCKDYIRSAMSSLFHCKP